MAGWMDGMIKSCTECMALQFCVGHAHALSHVTAADVAVHRRLKRGHASLLTADAIRRGAYPTAQKHFFPRRGHSLWYSCRLLLKYCSCIHVENNVPAAFC